ncbi:MAG: hypothetical protein ACR2I0_08330, partial [Rhodoferax sp.]
RNIGNLWIIWQEPKSFTSYNSSASEFCPVAIRALQLDPPPRCVFLPFTLRRCAQCPPAHCSVSR